MKSLFLIYSCVLVYFIEMKGQFLPDGIYLTCSDLKSRHPFYVIDSSDKFKFKFPAGSHNIKITSIDKNNKKIKTVRFFYTGSIFAYCYKGRLYRYFASDKWSIEDDYYLVEDTSYLVIYSHREGIGRYGMSTKNYYFSINMCSDIYPLKKKYLQKVLSAEDYKKIESLKEVEKREANGVFLINQSLK